MSEPTHRTPMIPYGKQLISESDIEAVVNVLRSDWLTQGPSVEAFENTVAEYCGVPYAVAVNSATSALHIACLAAGLGAGDVLWTSPNTFVASANCARFCGADVDFVDIDPHTYNLSPHALAEKLASAKKKDILPKVLIPVHFAGQSCDMDRIARLASEYGIIVLEDASHAIGARYRSNPVGSCDFSDMTVFSFHPVKIITTGEGGMVLTKRKDLYDNLIRLRSHGITREPALMDGESHGPWYYQQIELGFNYRMTDIQAALGTSQMTRLDEFVRRRHLLADRYRTALDTLPVSCQMTEPDCYSSLHLFVIRLKLSRLQKTHRQIFDALRESGILVNLHYIPVHSQPYYRNLGFSEGDFPLAEAYYREAISLPLYPGLSEEDQDFVIDALRRVLV